MKKWVLFFLFLLVAQTAFALPNPMAAEPSTMLLEKEMQITVLTMPPGQKFYLDKIFTIDKKVAELRYKNEASQEIHIRTAKKEEGVENISGLYTKDWEDWNIGCLFMRLGFLGDSAAAYWSDGDRNYAVFGKNFERQEFIEMATAIYMSVHREI